jgi:alpha-L-fucosidase
MPHYEPTIESLSQYRVPQWYKDAKLGIYTHWGPYSVPAWENEWYPRTMYDPKTKYFKHHRRTWGDQSQFGYKDFIPMFTAKNWDPEYWADLFRRAGAKFAGPVAEHHDGFAMYDTSCTPYTSLNMGPKRDVTAEQKKAFEVAGMKFITTSHRARNARHFPPLAGSDRNDPQYKDLYWKVYDDKDAPVDQEFLKDWLKRTIELIDKYEPDVLWFDFGWHRDEFLPHRLELVSYYYNWAEKVGKEVVMNYKDHVFDGAAVFNVERGKLAGIREDYWQTDTSVSKKAWSFIENDDFKTATHIVHDFIDIVSKNGNCLLNFGPRADGTIPAEVEGLLLAQGKWLETNGEAIYGSRHWERFGEGPTVAASGGFSDKKADPFTPQDFRFTQKANAIYAIELGWPGVKTTIKSLANGTGVKAEDIESVAMLGISGELEWRQDHEGLHVMMPEKRPCDHAYSFRIKLKDVSK